MFQKLFDLCVLSCFCLLFAVVTAAVATRKSLRVKRGLMELAGMIKCSTHNSALDYMLYGCYCGLGGQGMPKDQTDRCCFRHDCCYGEAEDKGCKTKTAQYHWKCDDEIPECDLEDHCEELLCECDRDFVECLKRARFDLSYKFWPNFMCGHDHLTCN
uniref:Phospholipase A2 n=1 Tax=Cynoglossus semilaevis TaxID=244447 RepID=A0A3P8X626_CYNSE